MRRTISVLLSLCLATAVAGQQPAWRNSDLSDPIEILKKVDAATKAVKSVKYKITFRGTGAAESRAPNVEGTVFMSGWSDGTPKNFRFEAKIRRPESSEVVQITVGSDGEDFYFVDHKAKKAYVDIDPEVMGTTGRPAMMLRVAEFLHPSPFSDEINAEAQELKGSKTIGGEDCYEVLVSYGGRGREAIWHFSKKDFLPRARLDLFPTPSGEKGGQQRTITDLVVDPQVDKDSFRFRLPKGYTRTDDFAP